MLKLNYINYLFIYFYYSWASSFCHHISTILGLRWQLRGREHLEKDQACIIVANHQSSIDILGMFDIWPVMNKCTVVAKKELWYAWPFGLAAWLCGLIFIDRSRLKSDQARTSLTAATEVIKLKKVLFKYFFIYMYHIYVWTVA